MTDKLLSLFHFANSNCGTKTGALPSLYDNLSCDGDGNITLSSVSELVKVIANVVRILIAVSGSLAIILILIAAVYYITSAGDPSRVKKAKDILVNTVIGLVLIIAAYAIITFIAGGL